MPRGRKGRSVKMGRLETVAEWADKYGVSLETATAYQAARRNWMNRVSAYARKTGGPRSQEIPADIRMLRPQSGLDFDQYLQYRTSVIRERSSRATRYLDERVNTYFQNLLVRMSESPSLETSNAPAVFGEWLAKANRQEKARFLNLTGGGGLTLLGYVKDEADTNGYSVAWDYDFSPVLDAMAEMGMLGG